MWAKRLSSPLGIVLALGGLYVGQSILGGLAFIALPSVLRERGVALDQIGLVHLISLPWALKIVWAAAVERYRLPPAGATRSRQIVAVCGLLTVLGLTAVSAIGPAHWLPLLAVLVAIAFAASTADIACDGHAVETLALRHHGWGNAAQVGGAYLGSAIGSGLFLILVARFGWSSAVLAAAGMIVALLLPFLLSPAPISPGLRSHRPSLRFALQRSQMRQGLILAAVYVVLQKWGVSMMGPFLIDVGLDLESIGLVNGFGGLAIGLVCALLGGGLVRWMGARRVMLLALLLQGAALGLLALAASLGTVPRGAMVGLALASSSGIMALGFVALYAQFMAIADPRQAGIDFTLLQGMDAIVSMAGGLGAGWVAQHLGFASYFLIAAVLAVLAAPVVAWLATRATSAA
ncbi:MFS transporter [Bosea vaviloviae]|uniref:MFS transporter n=1 Tax=Bosea vaviloviae TaxID=1526658 RepID=A0A1D7UBG6_9HYPH|nr:MFS transporter [Bosea vaviloviae]